MRVEIFLQSGPIVVDQQSQMPFGRITLKADTLSAALDRVQHELGDKVTQRDQLAPVQLKRWTFHLDQSAFGAQREEFTAQHLQK
ncbi:hypothetical protein OG2516_01541 [Oceanicola granulosus HTCC2516]|uniref:Uncharacterized protein n=1 Tax=Oceanicola granulosus (strain ATCC BAA-861 / DSM 15982 / KCTC 12143 / HTCC2516) TaxID=314256 RepID=Q2CFY1_OCEGH|nr:hypothetical protein OG2516_01541 [Oceanicola granulosus HTCC2516]